MALRAVAGEYLLTPFHRAGAKFLVELGGQLVIALEPPRRVQIRRSLREQERANFRKPVLDCAEIGTIAPALPDIERRLTVVALRWIHHEEVDRKSTRLNSSHT